MIYLLIYLLGYGITFTMCKYYRHKQRQNSWDDVLITLGYSSLSWGFLIILLIDTKFNTDRKYFKEPPKWL